VLERARFSPTSTKPKVEHLPLEETKGHTFKEVKFANDFDGAADNIKNSIANISRMSKSLSKTISDITIGPADMKQVEGTTLEVPGGITVPKVTEYTSPNSFRL